MEEEYFKTNRESWNRRTDIHYQSSFYDVNSFKEGKTSLNKIELDLLGEIKGKKLLHALCHFGQDSLSLAKMGADVTAFDLSDRAIEKAKELSSETKIPAHFINCNYYDLPTNLEREFDIFYLSYGVIGWLPDLEKWASIAAQFTKKGGRLIMAEFHPFIWMYDGAIQNIEYSYFLDGTIETEESSYTEKDSSELNKFVSWNHSLSEVISALIDAGFEINQFHEYDYSPYDCFQNTKEIEKGKFVIEEYENKLPLVYSIEAIRK